MTPRDLSPSERRDWLRLSRARGIGPVTFAELLKRYETASAALEALPELLRHKKSQITLAEIGAVEKELEDIDAYGGQLLCACEPDYPNLLKQVSPPPPVITVFGNTDLFAVQTVAIVGSRNASAAGRKISRDLAKDLGRAGFVIVSGLARGVDGEAHAAALDTGTIAVLAGGINRPYPPQHERLHAAIAEQGLLVSENPFGHTATARDFPRRNRIITGLSIGTIVVEAAERSGSLISARTAAEQNREVMAVPGSPLEPRSAGTNQLIRQGALLVRSAEDVIEQLGSTAQRHLFDPGSPFEGASASADFPSSDDIQRVKEALNPHPMPIDEIARAAGLSSPACSAILMELELTGVAVTLAGGLAHLS